MAKTKTKKVLLSGMRPTGNLHIGHLFGTLQTWKELQETHECYFMIADLHALITLENTENVKKDTLSMLAWWLAAGIRPTSSTIFLQSNIPEHAELAFILSNLAPLGELEANPVYKEMKEQFKNKNTLGLLSYPVLQAADILIYKPEAVPVGKDQAKHVEIARETARRFNNAYGLTFPWPKEIFSEYPKIASLQDPSKKMSKSGSPASYIALEDDKKTIEQKIKRAVTDSGTEILYDAQKKPALAGLIILYQLVSHMSIDDIEKKFKNSGYAQFKDELAWKLSTYLAPVQTRYKNVVQSKSKLSEILSKGTESARKIAQHNLNEAKKKMGLLV